MSDLSTVTPIAGAGLVARAGDLLLVVADKPGAEQVLQVFAAAAADGVDGNTLVRRVAALLAGDEDGQLPACAVGGPAQNRFAVLVSGAAMAEVTGADGPVRLSGADAITAVSRFVPGPVSVVRLLLPGAGPTVDDRLHLAGGVVAGAGLAAGDGVARFAVAVPGSGAHRAASAAAAPAQRPAPAAAMAPASVVAQAEPEALAPEAMASEAAPLPSTAPPADSAISADPPMPVRPPAMVPPPQPVMAAPPVAPPARPSAPPVEPPMAPPMAGQEPAHAAVQAPVEYSVVPPAGPYPPPPPFPPVPPQPAAPQAPAGPPPPPPAPPVVASLPRVPDAAKPFDSVILLPGIAAPAEVPVPAAPADPRPMVLGVLCKNDHFNDPDLRYCQVCGISMAQQTLIKHEGPRPPLGVLLFDDGMTFRLDVDYLVGREPGQDPAVLSGQARPLRVVDPQNQVSRVHTRVALVGWQVQLVDLSANGTYLRAPGQDAPVRVAKGQAVPLKPGAQIHLGQRWFRYESHRNP